jgi:hypothetical protein
MVQAKPTTPVINTGDSLYPNLICALPLQDGTGTTAHDLSGLGYNATLTGGATWFNDPTLGTVLQLDGTSGFLTLASNLNAALLASLTGVTVSMWLKLRNNQPTVATKTGLMTIQSYNTGTKASKWPAGGSVTGEVNGLGYLSTFRDNTNTSVTGISLGATDKSQWHLLTIASQAGGQWTAWLNGVQLTTVISANPIGATLTAVMGQSPSDTNGGPYYLDGWVGDFRAYNLALITPQVQSLFNSPWNLYTITTPISQSRLEALTVDATYYLPMSERMAAIELDMYFNRGSVASSRTSMLMIDGTPYHDAGASIPPNDPGLIPLNQTNAFNPSLKPLNSPVPTLNADAVNTNSTLAMPLSEGYTGSSTAPTLTLASGGTLAVGTFFYAYSFVSPLGESSLSTVASITTNASNKTVNLTTIVAGPAGTTARNIYRATTNANGSYQLIGTIADNTTTVFSDGGLAAGANGPFEVNDRSGNGNNGTFVNTVSWDTSISSYYYINRVKAPSLKFSSGSGSYVRVPRTASLEPTTNYSIAAWVRPAAFPSINFGTIVGKVSHAGTDHSYFLGATTSGAFVFYQRDITDGGAGQSVTGGSYPNSLSGGPYFIVGTYDGSLQRLYVNGALVNSIGDSGAIDYTTPGDFYIGGTIAGNGTFNGDIDEVRMWNRVLSATEIANMWSVSHSGSGTTTAVVPVLDAASGAYGAFSTGAMTNVHTLIVDASYHKQAASSRVHILMIDGFVRGKGTATDRMMGIELDWVPVATTVSFAGVWSSAVTYSIGQIVIYNGQEYVSLTNSNLNNVPSTSTANWSPYSQITMGIGVCTPNQGTFNGGTVVQVSGQYFRNVTAVYIGGISVAFTVLSDSLIQFTTPAHAAGFVQVRVDSSTYGTVTADRIFQYVGGQVAGQATLFRGKLWTTSMWHQDPPGSFYTGMTTISGSDAILPFTLTDNPTTAQAVEVYVRHTGETGYSRMRYLVDWDVDLTNLKIIWKATAPFNLVSTDEMIVIYFGLH